MLWPRIKAFSTGLGHFGGQFPTSSSSLCSNKVLLIFLLFFTAHIAETKQSLEKGILGSTWYWETSERRSLGQERGACVPRSGGQVPRLATTLLPLRSHRGGRATARAPLSSAGLPSLSGHRKRTAAQAGPGLFLLLRGLGTRGDVLLSPWGKAFVAKQGFSFLELKLP